MQYLLDYTIKISGLQTPKTNFKTTIFSFEDAISSPGKKGSTPVEDLIPFSWKEYLKESKAVAAPPSFFKQVRSLVLNRKKSVFRMSSFRQALVPPSNEFVVGSKLEALDPRSQMACIATVCGKKSRTRRGSKFLKKINF